MKGYVEAPWRGLVISGQVELPDGVVTAFAAENKFGFPVRVPNEHMPAALEQLVVAARELQDPESETLRAAE